MDYKKLSKIADSKVFDGIVPYYGSLEQLREKGYDKTTIGKTAVPEYKTTLSLFKRICKKNGGRAYSWNFDIGWTGAFLFEEDALKAKEELNQRGLTVLLIVKQIKQFQKSSEWLEKYGNVQKAREYDLLNSSDVPFFLVLSESGKYGNEGLIEHWTNDSNKEVIYKM